VAARNRADAKFAKVFWFFFQKKQMRKALLFEK
jgi:hypothetical protein